jgi:hypothetical protein
MKEKEEHYKDVPFYRVRRLTAWLRAQGYVMNSRLVSVLLPRMGLQAIYPIRARPFLRGLGYRVSYKIYFGY